MLELPTLHPLDTMYPSLSLGRLRKEGPGRAKTVGLSLPMAAGVLFPHQDGQEDRDTQDPPESHVVIAGPAPAGTSCSLPGNAALQPLPLPVCWDLLSASQRKEQGLH